MLRIRFLVDSARKNNIISIFLALLSKMSLKDCGSPILSFHIRYPGSCKMRFTTVESHFKKKLNKKYEINLLSKCMEN